MATEWLLTSMQRKCDAIGPSARVSERWRLLSVCQHGNSSEDERTTSQANATLHASPQTLLVWLKWQKFHPSHIGPHYILPLFWYPLFDFALFRDKITYFSWPLLNSDIKFNAFFESKNGSVWKMGKVEEAQNKNLNQVDKKMIKKKKWQTHCTSAVCVYKGDWQSSRGAQKTSQQRTRYTSEGPLTSWTNIPCRETERAGERKREEDKNSRIKKQQQKKGVAWEFRKKRISLWQHPWGKSQSAPKVLERLKTTHSAPSERHQLVNGAANSFTVKHLEKMSGQRWALRGQNAAVPVTPASKRSSKPV